jgi:hypothetical protein
VDALPWLVAGILWTTLMYKVRALRRTPANRALRFLCCAFCAFALALTVDLPPVYAGVDQLVGEPNFAELLGHALALIGGWATQSAVLHFQYDGPVAAARSRRRAVVLLSALGAMTLFFLMAPLDRETRNFTIDYVTAPYMAQYWLAYLAYLAFALVDVARLSWTYATIAGGGYLGVGLRMLAAGSAFGLLYAGNKALFLALRGWTDVEASYVSAHFSRIAIAACFSLVAVGTTLPSWGPRLQRIGEWILRYRTHRRLYRLWTTLQAVSPEIALTRPQSAIIDALSPRDLHFRLYRRVIEIRDGQLALRPYMNPAVRPIALGAAASAGLTGNDLAAAAEAAVLVAAIRAKTAGQRQGMPDEVREPAGGSDFMSEAAWLIKVARFFKKRPVVEPAGPVNGHVAGTQAESTQ